MELLVDLLDECDESSEFKELMLDEVELEEDSEEDESEDDVELSISISVFIFGRAITS